jgi:hypothetical protein
MHETSKIKPELLHFLNHPLTSDMTRYIQQLPVRFSQGFTESDKQLFQQKVRESQYHYGD